MKKKLVIALLSVILGLGVCSAVGYAVLKPILSECKHEFGEWQVETKATCAAEGEKIRVCSKCGETERETLPKTDEHVETVIPATEPTCNKTGLTEGKKCSVCGKILVKQTEIEKLPHTEEILEAVKATCTQTGLTEGKKCSVCGEILVEQQEIPLAEHVETVIPASAPTCTKTGLTAGKKCGVCGKILLKQTTLPKSAHSYGAWTTDREPTCSVVGNKRRSCAKCGNIENAAIPKIAHTEEILEAVEPTCTKTGLTEGKKCGVCGEVLVAQEIIEKIAHSYGEWIIDENPTCTGEGSKHRVCSVCSDEESAAIDSLGHSYGEWIIDENPTCTGEGSKHRVCSVCSDEESATIDSLGHDYGEWITDEDSTCTKTGTKHRDCERDGCDEVDSAIIEKRPHTEVTIDGKEPTCEDTGLTEGKRCSKCGETLIEQEVIPAKGHTEVTDNGKEPTCEDTGLTEGKHCSECGKTLIEQEVIPAKGHTEVTDDGEEPTCENTGLTAGKHCSTCGKTLVGREVIPAKGHTEVTLDRKEPTCENAGLTEGKRCSTCGKTLVAQEVIPAEGHAEVIDEAVPGTCISKGLTEGSHCSKCGKVLVAQIETVTGGHGYGDLIVDEPATCTDKGLGHRICDYCNYRLNEKIDALGHNYGEWIIDEKGSCSKQEKRHRICARCSDVQNETIIPEGHVYGEWVVIKEPACSEDGLNCKTCEKCGNKEFKLTTALAHVYGNWIIDKKPTCSIAGEKHKICYICGTSFKAEIDPLGHTEEIIPATEANCLKDGLTEGKKCSVCGEILESQNSISNLYNHAYGEWIIDKAATATQNGSKHRICKNCRNREDVSIHMLGHNKLYSIQDDNGTINVIWKCADSDCSDYGRVDNVAAYSITTAPTCTSYGWARLTYSDKTIETVQLNVAHKLNGVAMIEADSNNKIYYDYTIEGIHYNGNPRCNYRNSDAEGYFICDSCTYIVPVYVKAAHIYSAAYEHKDASCTENGYNKYICTVCCGGEKTEILQGEHVLSYKANKNANGKITSIESYCSVCDYSETYSNYKIIKVEEPTCSKSGKYILTMQDNSVVEFEIPALPHYFKLSNGDKFEVDANKVYTIADYNGNKYSEYNWVKMIGNGEIASCDESGNRSACFSCKGCNEIVILKVRKEHFCSLDMQTEEQYEKSVHDCTQNGVVYYTCKNCKKQVEEKVNATEHNKVYSLYNKNGSTFAAWRCLNNFCLVSGNEKVKSFDVTTSANCTSYGLANVEFENGTIEEIKLDINRSIHRIGTNYIVRSFENNNVFYDYGTEGIYLFGGENLLTTCDENILRAKGANGWFHCSDCGKNCPVIVRKPHTLVPIEGVAPTCTKAGLTEGAKCSTCGKIYQKEIPALRHNYGEWEIDEEPACAKEGSKHRVCSVCSNVEREAIDSLGHNYGEWEIDEEPTCIKAGTQHKKCDRCGDEATESIDMIAHNYENGVCTYCKQTDPELYFTFSYVDESEQSYQIVKKGGVTLPADIVIPATFKGLKVTKIRDYAFYGCSEIMSVTIPDTVTIIGDSAFFGCSGFTSITIPNSVTTIYKMAFAECSRLTSIKIPNSVTSIGELAFLNCGSLEKIEVEKGNAKYCSKSNCLIEISTKTLILGCKNSVIPSDGSVTTIDGWAFYNCSGLTSVTIPSSVTSIGSSAFYNCSSLTSVTIANGVKKIYDYAFENCKNLAEIKFNGTVKQWESISLGYGWKDHVPATNVVCSDGTVKL